MGGFLLQAPMPLQGPVVRIVVSLSTGSISPVLLEDRESLRPTAAIGRGAEGV